MCTATQQMTLIAITRVHGFASLKFLDINYKSPFPWGSSGCARTTDRKSNRTRK